MKHMAKFHVKLRLRIIKHMELLQIYCSIIELARLPVYSCCIYIMKLYCRIIRSTECIIRFDQNMYIQIVIILI